MTAEHRKVTAVNRQMTAKHGEAIPMTNVHRHMMAG
jgi:hypothetical protein